MPSEPIKPGADRAAAPADDLLIDWRPGHNGDVVLTARLGAAVLHQDQVALAKATDRDRFTDELCRHRPGIDAAAVRQRLLELADVVEREKARRRADGKGGGRKAAPRRVEPYQPFPVHLLPGPVARLVGDGAAAMGCDPAFLALPLLTAMASAVGNARRLRLKQSWSEPSVLWTVVVADSGSLKSPAMERALRPLVRRQKRAWREYQRTLAEHRGELKAWKATPKAERGEEPEPPPACPQLFCSDVTVEALADRLEKSPRGLLVAVDELAGWFASFNQYRQGRGGDVTHYLSMHRAGLLKVDRKTGDKTTTLVPYAAVSVTGGIQPGTLGRVLTQDFFENGLAARLLVAMPPRKVKRWTEADVKPAVEQGLERVFDGLLALKPDADLDGDLCPVEMDLTDAAKAAWVAFYDAHGVEQGELEGGELAAWSKLEGYAARVALVIHLARLTSGDPDADERRVDELSMAAGIELARWFGREARRVYAVLRESDGERSVRDVLDLVRQLSGRATVRDLVQRRRKYRNDPSAAEADLQSLADAGLGRWESPPPGPKGGHPSRVLVLVGGAVNGVNVNGTPVPGPAGGGNDVVDAVDAPVADTGVPPADPRLERGEL